MKKELIKKISLIGITALIMSNINYISASAKWVRDLNNHWNWIENKVKATGWKQLDGKWYYFDTNGIMYTGWISYNGNWYNLSNSGEMNTGWKMINGIWYYFNSDGKMSTGWVNDNGTWYYINPSGEMETGTLSIDGKKYTFSESGAMIDNENKKEQPQINLDYESNTKSDVNPRVAYVSTNGDSLNVRAKAVMSSDIIGTLTKGTEIKLIDNEKNGFYPVKVNGKEGWVSSKWVSFEKPKNVLPISTSINITNKDNEGNPSINDDKNNVYENEELDGDSLGKGVIRDKEPSKNNKYYYSDNNLFYKVKLSPPFLSGGKPIKGNCTWYAWGRAWELTGIKPEDAGFIGNACEWWNANKKSGKYKYGSKPRVGAIAVWKSTLPSSGGSGHVAIVEKISDGKIYISESSWHGDTFRYREIYETDYLYGYIYLDKPNY